MDHMIIGIQQVNNDNIKDVEKSLQSILLAAEPLDRVFTAFVIRDDIGNHIGKLREQFGYCIMDGSYRSRARNMGFDQLNIFASHRSIIHFIDCDQIIDAESFMFIEEMIEEEGYQFVGTLRKNLINGDGKITRCVLDERFDEEECVPSWSTMYSNFISLRYNIIRGIRFNEEFIKWGHEDILYAYEISKRNNHKIKWGFNKDHLATHIEHTQCTDPNIPALEKIKELHPELGYIMNCKIEQIKSTKRSGFRHEVSD